MIKTLLRTMLKRNIFKTYSRFFSEISGHNQGASSASLSQPKVNANVPGLSSAVIHQASKTVGPGVDPNKSGPYKVPEYFCYDNMSYFEAEIEMARFRLPQPSAVKK